MRRHLDTAETFTAATRQAMLLALPSWPWHPQWLYRRRWRNWQQLARTVLDQNREGGEDVTLAENHRLMHEHSTATADAYRQLILPLMHWRRRKRALGILARLDPSGPEALTTADKAKRKSRRSRTRQADEQ